MGNQVYRDYPFRTGAITMKKPILVLLLAFWTTNAYCCSTFCLSTEDRVVSGRNMDFHVDGGVIVVNPRGLTKTAIPARPMNAGENRPATWTARYGSLTFSLACRELPSSGINERGLVVNEMTLGSTEYPRRDDRPEVIPAQWIQYQLDNCATVDEVLATDKVIRMAGWDIAPRGHHFLITDKTGKTAVIEFLDGKRIVHTGDSLPVKALTNDTYDDSVGYLRQHRNFGGNIPIPPGPRSTNRFVCLADLLRRHSLMQSNTNMVDYAFEALGHVGQGQSTVWSIVYDATNEKVYYRTHVNPEVRSIDLGELDFSPSAGAKILSINNPHRGDVTDRFVDYTAERNLGYLMEFARKDNRKLNDELMEQLKRLSRYPESFVEARE